MDYAEVGNFNEGLAWFRKHENFGFIFGFIDKNGNLYDTSTFNSVCVNDDMVIFDDKYLTNIKDLGKIFIGLVTINGEKFKKEFETEEKRDEYLKTLNAYIEGRRERKEYEVNQKKREFESLIKKLEEDILSIENNYCDDIKKAIGDYYKNYKM